MNFSFTDDQLAIRELAGKIFADHASDEALLAFARSGQSYDDSLWSVLAAQGLLGIAVPESAGGSGLDLMDVCLVLEEQGHRVAPVPLLATLVLGGLPIRRFGTASQQQRWLTALADGRSRFSAAIADVGMNPALTTTVSAHPEGEGWVLHGNKAMVPDGAVADFILVPVVTAAGDDCVMVVAAEAAGVTVEPVALGLAGTRAAHVRLDGVLVDGQALLGAVGQGAEIVDWLEQQANVAQCALQVGVTEAAMRRTAAYLGERRQFGVALGTFQALAMRMADSYIDVEAIRSTYWLALWRLSQGLDARAEVRAAKWWACDAAHRVVSSAQHLHGGMGADVEYPIHRFFLMAKEISYSLGSAGRQLEQLGELLASDDSLGFHALAV